MVRVFIPASLRNLTGGEREVDVEASSVREAIEELERRFPGIRDRLCAGDRLRPGLAVAVDSRISDRGLLEPLPPQCELHFLPSVSGG